MFQFKKNTMKNILYIFHNYNPTDFVTTLSIFLLTNLFSYNAWKKLPLIKKKNIGFK